MPTIARFKKIRIYFYASDLGERPHIHVTKKGESQRKGIAKFWLTPEVSLYRRGDLTDKDIVVLERVLRKNRDLLMSRIEDFRNGRHIETINLD